MRSARRRLGAAVLASATLVVGAGASAASAQSAAPEDHEQHHPPASSPGSTSGTPGPARAPAMGSPPAPSAGTAPASPMQMMREMEREMGRMMGAPARKPILSRLLDVERLSPPQRRELEREATREMERGMRLLQEGTRTLEAARRRGDLPAIERSLATLREGATAWETGRAVQRALASAPDQTRAAGLRWFKAEMNIDARPPVPSGLPWGLSWMQLAILGGLVTITLGGLVLYAYRVRRAVALLRRLTAPGERR